MNGPRANRVMEDEAKSLILNLVEQIEDEMSEEGVLLCFNSWELDFVNDLKNHVVLTENQVSKVFEIYEKFENYQRQGGIRRGRRS